MLTAGAAQPAPAAQPPGEPAAWDVRQLFRAVAGRCPASSAIRSGDLCITYGELDLASDGVAAALRQGGAGQGAAVAILCERPEDVICAMLAALKAGAIFVPLDPRTPRRRLQAMLEVAAPAAFVVGEDRGAELAAESDGGAPVLHLRGGALAGAAGAGPRGEAGAALAGAAAAGPPPALAEMGPDSPCYLYFTSGSTGQPKAITGRFKSIAHFIGWEIETFGVAPGWRVSQLIHPSFDAFLRDVLVPLCAGGTVCIPPDRETVADGERLLAWLGDEDVQLVHCVPSLFRTLLHVPPRPLPSLRWVLTSGEPLLPADVKRWTERNGASCRLVNLYGPSETTMTKLVYFVEPADAERRTIPIGRPMPGARALVLDGKGAACPPRAVGEIYIRTPYRSLGYHRRPDLTAEVFVRNPFTQDPDDLVYKTGDLGRVLADGNLEFLGRKDGQVKIRGVRIEVAEIENLLLSHPRVRDAVVVDLEGTDGTRFLCAYVVLGDEAGLSGLRDFLAESLSEHSLPSAFVALDELPRTLSGKVDRRALPPPARVHRARGQALDLPRTQREEIVAGLFAQVLGLGQIGIHESFFELGGHSLLATQLLARVRSRFDVEVPLRGLFAQPTIAGLAAQVEAAVRGHARVRRDRSGPPPLSFGQERFWKGRHREAQAVPATIPMLVALDGPVDLGCLRQALQAMVDRHEMLRTTFRDEPAGPILVVASELAVRLPVVDLEGLAAAEQWAEIRRLAIADARSPFDLERGPLFRTTVFRRSPRQFVALCTLHHAAFDGWSDALLVGEVSALYVAFRAGRPSPLPPLAVQYQDFSRWQRHTFAGEALARQVAYWREHLRGAVPVDLGRGRPRPARRTFAAGWEDLTVPEALESQLEAFAARQGVTLFMTLLAAFKALLRDATRQEDVVVTCMFANRDQAELEDLIGYFSGGLPLRTSGARTFRELVERVREVTLAAHEHPYILYEPVLDGASFLEPGDRGGITSFRVMFQLAKLPPATAQGTSDVRITWLPLDTGWIGQDLTLFLTQSGRLAGRFRYSRDVLDAPEVARLRDRFLQILAAAAADPDRPLGELLARELDPGDGQHEAVARAPEPGEGSEAHRVALPDGSGEWELWRCACLRGAGFPVDEVSRLASAPAAAAADRLRAAGDEAERCRGAARDALSREIGRAGRDALDVLVKALQRVKKGKLPGAADLSRLPPGARAALEDWATADEQRRRAGDDYLACYSAEMERLGGELRAIVRDPRFREAILWQNRQVLETALDRLGPARAGQAPRSKQRQHEQVAASYLQRFCAKNDTIGFFGPVGWAEVGLGAEPLAVRHGAGFLAQRRVFFEGWCIDAVAEALAAEPEVRAELAPRRGLFVRADGEVLGRARPAPERRALLALCDGATPARELATRLVAARIWPDVQAVYAALAELQAAGLLAWGFDLPRVLEPERELARQLERLPAGGAREAALRRLADFEACRHDVARAAGDDQALDAALGQLERCFTGFTGLDPSRAHGETYAGRSLVFEDCRRGTEVTLGAGVLAELAPPLALLLTAARWLTWTAAELYRGRFAAGYARLSGATGSRRVGLADLCRTVLPSLFDPGTGPVEQQVLPDLWRRWAEVLELQSEEVREVTCSSAELRPRVMRAFSSPAPGWTTARHHSPDLLIAASGPEAIRRGDYRFVLGELHVAANTLATNLFVGQHPSPGELIAAMERDVPEPCVYPVLPKSWRREQTESLLGFSLPWVTGRGEYGLAAAKDLHLEVTASGLPRRQVLQVAELFVEPGEGGLQVVASDGRRFELLDFLQTVVKAQVASAFSIFPPRPHLPRVTVDRLVLCRESWTIPAAEIEFARAASAAERFAGARRWADRMGLPRLVFVKSPQERKPLFLDFASPLSVEIAARVVRHAAEAPGGQQLALSEMLPGPDDCWLPDAAGRRYTSELRLVAFDRSRIGAARRAEPSSR